MNDKVKSVTANPAKSNVVIERSYRTRVEELWDLWTTKEGFESWWGPEGFRVEVRTLDARPGGALHYAMIADTPEMIAAMKQMGQPSAHETHGWFSELKTYERLTLLHLIDFLPGVKPYESTIVAEFFPSGDRARMVVTLYPMHDEEMTNRQRMGFTSQHTKLDKRFADKKQ